MDTKCRLHVARFMVCAALLGLAMSDALAQDYPNKQIRFIVTYPPGGGTDTAARIIAEQLSTILGQQVLIDNRGGADGRIGTKAIAEAEPDGYTIGFVASSHSTNPSLYKNLPYDTLKGFEAISSVGNSFLFLVVHPSVPARSLAEFVTLAKSKPGKLNYSLTGLAVPGLTAELFKQKAGVDVLGIPYKGGSEVVTSVLGGYVEMCVTSVSTLLPHVKAGNLKALAISSAKRSPLAPDVPTFVESGYPDVVTATWYAVLASARTPKPIIAKLNNAIVRVLNMPDVRERLVSLGMEASPSTPERLDAYIRSELVMWSKVIKDAGIQPQ